MSDMRSAWVRRQTLGAKAGRHELSAKVSRQVLEKDWQVLKKDRAGAA
jgi:hypothetical protein